MKKVTTGQDREKKRHLSPIPNKGQGRGTKNSHQYPKAHIPKSHNTGEAHVMGEEAGSPAQQIKVMGQLVSAPTQPAARSGKE